METSFIAIIFLSYLLGSISSAILVCRLSGYGDPRDTGSGNPGATNVLRIGGKKAALLTLLGDMLKGVIPVAALLAMNYPVTTAAAAGLAAFIGHLFPVYFHFKGGKGVATFFGVLLALNFKLGLLATGIWLICAFTFKISSLSALITAFVIPMFSWFFFPQQFPYLVTMCALLIIRHHSNIRKLLSGDESSIGNKAS
ncbi:glycerol-3-phosphate 1-O-acyltransferase PlsY [Pleionea sp. CnH1-48]|uniref:glycerol-3-phosphate 1-O-acyltransferase PlsY n=1 Tax=Pleionea sp. CnH1-48 TaxID=2954494 RepID=UPI0020984E7E|nr:glycerol-3-phosphate 1-O-acyltransferase PlsY [Pleionea sp. CnH1-48]MCO7225616.1 glycerol-3-phosphate 1-O-acyltransferase PlsY [Pleionea sp. CnH1-48]